VKNNGHRGLGVAIYHRHQVWLSWLHYSGVSNFSITAEMLVASTNGPIYAPIRLQHISFHRHCLLFEISDSHGGEYEDDSLLGYYAL
jgi:hypothetical protein